MKDLSLLILLCFSLLQSTNAQVNLQDSLKLYLPFHNADVNDATGAGYTVSVGGAIPIIDRFCNDPGAYYFPPTFSYIGYGDILDEYIAGPNQQFTISLWMKSAREQMANTYLFTKRGDTDCNADERELLIRTIDNKINFTYENERTFVAPRYITGETFVNDTTKWHHVLVTYDGTTNGNNGRDRVNIYVNCHHDNVTLDPGSMGTLSYIKDGTASIGLGNTVRNNGTVCNTTDINRAYNGSLDDVRFYNRILNTNEIMALCSDTANCDSTATAIRNYSTEELLENQIIIYPNPTQGVINFKNITLGNKQVYIYDLQGKLLGNHQLQNQLEIAYLSNGVYLITVIDEKTGKTSTQKVSVQK